MKLPRGLSADELAWALRRYGYEVTRQTGSHIRLSTNTNGEHHITILDHKNLKVGTLSSILAEAANHLDKSREELIEELFGV